jgi:hypothetical protein
VNARSRGSGNNEADAFMRGGGWRLLVLLCPSLATPAAGPLATDLGEAFGVDAGDWPPVQLGPQRSGCGGSLGAGCHGSQAGEAAHESTASGRDAVAGGGQSERRRRHVARVGRGPADEPGRKGGSSSSLWPRVGGALAADGPRRRCGSSLRPYPWGRGAPALSTAARRGRRREACHTRFYNETECISRVRQDHFTHT